MQLLRLSDVSVGIGEVRVLRLSDHLQDFGGDAAGLEDVEADVVVQGQELAFVGREAGGFEEDVVGNAELADVVQEGGDFEEFELAAVPAEGVGKPRGENGDPATVPDGFEIAVAEG